MLKDIQTQFYEMKLILIYLSSVNAFRVKFKNYCICLLAEKIPTYLI